MSTHPGLFCRCLIVLILCGLSSIENPSLLQAQSILLPAPELITARQGLPQAFVPAIIQDRQGFIWMATRDGLCRYDGHGFTVFQPAPDGRPSLTSSGIAGVTLNHQGRLWISSEQGDLDLFDPRLETFINFSRLPFYKRQFGADLIDNYYPDRQNRLWIVFRRQGLVCIDLRTYRVRRFGVYPYQRQSLGGPDGGAIQQDRWGTVWVVAEKGLMQFDARTGRLRAYPLPDQDIRELYIQPDGLLLIRTIRSLLVIHPRRGLLGRYPLPDHHEGWVSHFTTDSQGSTYFNLDSLVLRFNQQQGIQPVAQVSYARFIRSLFIDRSDVLWMGTNGEGVRKYNLKAGAFEARLYQLNFHSDLLRTYFGVPSASLPHFPVGSSAYNFRYTFDQQGKLWFNAGSTPFYQLDLSTKKLTPIPFPARLALDNLAQSASLATDPDGRVWAIYDSLVVYYEKGQWKRFPFSIQSQVGLPALQLVVDREALWLATQSNGLYRVDRRSGQVRHYVPQPGNASSLSSRELIGLFADPLDANLLWIGTFGSGLCRFDKRTGQCRRLTTREGLPNNVVYSAIPDRQGFVWVATNQGLCQVDRRTFRTRTFTQEDGLQADEFNRFHVMHLPDDRIILGGITGMTAFDPAQIRDDTYQPVIQLTAIQVNNRLLPPVRDSLPVQAMQELDLPHDQNFVTVAFASMQYNRQTKIRYRYRLEGLDQDWIQTDRPVAGYTALRPGRYTLRLNASNTSGRWSPHVRTLTIVIRSPWWATGWAYGSYALLVGLLVYGLSRTWLNRLRLRQAIQLRQQEADQLRMLDETKSRFFANITHELRTPLTLILGPAERLKRVVQEPTWQRWLTIIDRNAHQLLDLINQLLDLAKLESGSLTVAESRGTVGEFIGELIRSFESAAETKRIQLIYQNQPDGDYWFDPGRLERIVYNLVANALKFTPAGGTIMVTLTATADRPGVSFTISDTGTGISADQLPYIFDRFYQARLDVTNPSATEPTAGRSSSFQPTGTGIGLALVKELVTLQGGSVQVQSQVGIGTMFTVYLPYRSVAPTDPATPALAESVTNPDEEMAGFVASATNRDEAPILLLVEDNAELLEFIASSLPAHYQIQRASNGEQGLAKALQWIPDVIISDVMMPVMDGYALCQQLKKDERTSHIPVILLTAKAALDSRMQGLAQGADDYLTKPFHVEELRLRVGNQLEHQRRLREQIRKQLSQPVGADPQPDALASNPFLEQLYILLDTHLDDSSFGVDELAARAYLSRQHLHRKLKVLTGLSSSDFIRTYRLKRATQLLRQGEQVSQTAYAVGFESPAHFSRSFRELYGMSPSEYTHLN